MRQIKENYSFYSNGAYLPRHPIERCERCGCLAFMHSDTKLLCPANEWESLADDFSIWAWGKEVPAEVGKLKVFFMRFVYEVANNKVNPPTKK